MVLVDETNTFETCAKLSDIQFEIIMEIDAPLMTMLENYNNWISKAGVSLPLKDNIESEGVESEGVEIKI